MSTYIVRFYRPANTRDSWYECNGIRINHRLGVESGLSILCKAMMIAGLPDGTVQTGEAVRAEIALNHQFESMYALANIPYFQGDTLPQIQSPKIHKALQSIASNPTNWKSVTIKADLLGRGFVCEDEGSAFLTDLGQQALELNNTMVERTLPKVFITPGQREAFAIVAANDSKKWNDLHGKTTNLMINSGWVEMDGKLPVLTGLGQDMINYVINRPVAVPKTDQAALATTFEGITEATYKYLIALRRNNAAWGDFGPRTKGSIKNFGYADPQNAKSATITSTGLAAISKYEAGMSAKAA